MVRRVRTSLGIACTWAGMFLLVGHSWAANGDQQVAFSGRANGMGGAVVAKPQDATTGLTNPAGIAFLDLGVDDIRFDVNLSASNPQRQLNDVDSENDLFVLATGAFAFKSDFVPDRMRISVGAYAIAGGGVDYPVGAYSIYPGTDGPVVAALQSLRMGPSFSYLLTDRLAIGLTTHMTIGMFSVDAPAFRAPTDFTTGFVWGTGLSYRLAPGVMLGLNYNAETNNQPYEFTKGLENTLPGCDTCPRTPQKYKLDFQDPQSAAVGLSIEPTDKLQIEFDVKWINFSAVRDTLVMQDQYSPDRVELELGWEDQWVYALGVNYKATPRLDLMLGYNYGKSPMGPEDIGDNPGINGIIEHHLSGGLSYRISEHGTLTASYMRAFENELIGIRTGSTEQVKSTFGANIVSLQFTYRH